MSRHLITLRLTQSVTLHTRVAGAEDEHGNPTETEVDTVYRGFAGGQSAFEGDQGEVIGETLTLYLEHEAPVTGWDACTIDGVRYEVIGHPHRSFNPRTASYHHVRATIRRAGTDA